MKLFYRFFGLLMIAGIILQPGSTRAGSLRDAVDVFLTAAGSQLPDPGLGTALSAAPGSITIGISEHCKERMTAIEIELMNNPPNLMELKEESNRYQAVRDAINGNPAPLSKLITLQTQKKKKQIKKKDRKEELDNLMLMLGIYRDNVNKLKAIHKKIKKHENIQVYTDIKKSLFELRILKGTIRHYENSIIRNVESGRTLCDRVRQTQKSIQKKTPDYLSTMQEGENLVNSKIDTAKQKFVDCQTDRDSIFVKRNFQAAKSAFSTMDTIRTDCQIFIANLKTDLKKIELIKKELNVTFNKKKWSKDKDTYYKRLAKIHKPVSDLTDSIKAREELPAKIASLKSKIIQSRTYHTDKTMFPKSKGQFDKLINDLDQIKPVTIIDPYELDRLLGKYRDVQSSSFADAYQSRFLFADTPPVVNCSTREQIETVLGRLDEMFFRALLVIEANKHLQNGCKKKVAVQAPSDENNQPPPTPPVNIDGSTPGTPPINPTGTDSNTIGGLIITGSTKVVTGQKVTYKACDVNGIPYTSGSFSWGHSDNSIMILDNKSGNSVIGVFNKVGTILLWVHYDDGTGYKAKAYLDIKITKAKGNLSTSGSEEQEKLNRHCNAITGQLQSARERGDINEYRSLLSRYKQCDFYDQALNFLAQMESNLQQQNELDNHCNAITGQLQSARERGDINEYRSLLSRYKQCDFYDQALNFLAQMESNLQQQNELDNHCNAITGQLQSARERGDINEYRSLLSRYKQCDFYDQALNFLAQMENDLQHHDSSTYPGPPDPFPSSGTTFPPIPADNPADYPGTGGEFEWGSSGNTGQSQNNKPSKSTGTKCQGHSFTCKGHAERYVGHAGKDSGWSMDSNKDGKCDVCGLLNRKQETLSCKSWRQGIHWD